MSLFSRLRKPKTTLPPKQKIPTRVIYTDKFGNEWREYVNPQEMPAIRCIAAEIATRWAAMKMTPEEFKRLYKEAKKEANKGDIVKAFSYMDEMERRVDLIAEETTLQELACCYYLLPGEDETDFSSMDRTQKLEIFKRDSAANDFFLDRSFRSTQIFSEYSDTPIHEYLNRTRIVLPK